jgi:hypothetical protein
VLFARNFDDLVVFVRGNVADIQYQLGQSASCPQPACTRFLIVASKT